MRKGVKLDLGRGHTRLGKEWDKMEGRSQIKLGKESDSMRKGAILDEGGVRLDEVGVRLDKGRI